MKKRLKSIAEIRTGYQFRGKVSADEDANVAVIQIKDIDGRLSVHLDDLVPVRMEKPEPYLVSQGDVLFLSRGHRLYAALISEPVQDTVATGYFFILRPNDRLVRSDFLAWYMNQPDFQDGLRPFLRGSHMPLISKSDFQNLTIKVPPLAVQQRILQLQHLSDREQLASVLQQKKAELVEAISRKLMLGQLKAKD